MKTYKFESGTDSYAVHTALLRIDNDRQQYNYFKQVFKAHSDTYYKELPDLIRTKLANRIIQLTSAKVTVLEVQELTRKIGQMYTDFLNEDF